MNTVGHPARNVLYNSKHEEVVNSLAYYSKSGLGDKQYKPVQVLAGLHVSV